MSSSYLERRAARVALERLKREIIFGMVVSLLLLGIGTWRYFVVVGASEAFWSAIAALGAAGLIIALVLPWLWQAPETVLTGIIRRVGGALFAVLLALVYALLVVPVGFALRRMKGTDPIYVWDGDVPARMEGWRVKDVLFEVNVEVQSKPSLFRRFLGVLQFFARRGHVLFLPMLVILIALGMVLFFVKSSALAPLIYTLF